MKLLLDVGNSRLKWRLLQDGRCLELGAVPVQPLPVGLWLQLPVPLEIYGACVASPEVEQGLERLCQQRWGLPVSWLRVSDRCCGVRNHYQSPGLGVDRWASVIAAHQQLSGGGAATALAVNAGTAITVDAVTAAGDYLGGTILPGLHLMRGALATHTARLPLAEGSVQAFPQTTMDAISTGIVDAACGAIERLRQRAAAPVLLLLSGGDAHQLLPYLPAPVHKVENLVLDGLQVIRQ